MITVEQARRHLRPEIAKAMSDEEVERLLAVMRPLAEIVVESVLQNGISNRPPHPSSARPR